MKVEAAPNATLDGRLGSVGLDSSEARRRLIRYGPNRLPEPPREWPIARLLHLLAEPMSLLLIAAALIAAFLLEERIDGAVILAIVIVNAAISFVQERRAESALEALRLLETEHARVVRDGKTVLIDAAELVPGDLVLLAAGDRVPADLQLVEARALEIDESTLTGESLAVSKDASFNATADTPLADRRDAAFLSTIVTRGSGRGLCVATGERTQLGAIAGSMRRERPDTPLQNELARLTARLGTVAVGVAVVVFGIMLVLGGSDMHEIERALLSAVALAVAAVPEGLASVVAIALALGVRRMAQHGAIVRSLPAVETLGSTEVLLTDKTGTLTLNKMNAAVVVPPVGSPIPASELTDPERSAMHEVAALCNDADLEPPSGDPLEIALLEFVGAIPVRRKRERWGRIDEAPFDSNRKMMSTLHRAGSEHRLMMKGAPEEVLRRTSTYLSPSGDVRAMSIEHRDDLLATADRLASEGTRMIALARRAVPEPAPVEKLERELTLVGLVGLQDPLRIEAAAAVDEARGAGIRIVMVTGDHPGTARRIAAEVGIHPHEPASGSALRERDPDDRLGSTNVYARVDPQDKLDLLEAFRAQGRVTAVTGDGVNDVPALQRADIGVAMGRAGSDAARRAADMVITDDNLATIVTAVREGRGIYDNIRKVVDYLVSANLAEILVVVSVLFAFPDIGVPLLPLQLLWINLVTDGLPAIALGLDPVDPSVMERPPRRAGNLLSRARLLELTGRATVMAVAAVAVLIVSRFAWDDGWRDARSLMFTTLATTQLIYGFAIRRIGRSGKLAPNRWLIAGAVVGLALMAAVTAWTPAQDVFGTEWPGTGGWAVVAGAGTLSNLILIGWDRIVRRDQRASTRRSRSRSFREAQPDRAMVRSRSPRKARNT